MKTSAWFLCVALVAGWAPCGSLAAQESPDIAGLFDLGALVLDTNGDSVPDLVNASLVLGDEPTVAEVATAAEISARLGFETLAMDLPLARGTAGGEIAIVVGRGGLDAAGLASPGIDPASLDSGEGVVAVREAEGRTWVLVVGGDDEGLLAAARLFAGVLPHTRTLSTARLDRVRDDLATPLEEAGIANVEIRLMQARTRAGEPAGCRAPGRRSLGTGGGPG